MSAPLEDMTLAEAIAALGWKLEWSRSKAVGTKRVVRADGSLVVDGNSNEVWAAVHREWVTP